MSDKTKNTGIVPIFKTLIVTLFRLMALVIAFVCKIMGLILTNLSEILEKLSGNGTH